MRLPAHHRLVVSSLLALTVLTAVAPTAGATESEKPITHCVAEVIDQEKSGEYVLSEPDCYEEYADAMDAAAELSGDAARGASIQATLAVHFDGANYTGSSFSVVGVDCLGGYINMSAVWDNRVSSTFSNFCPRIRHWTAANKGGNFQDTVSSGNLSAPVNNLVSSIQYLT